MAYRKLLDGNNLEENEVREIMSGILGDQYSDIQKGAILTAFSIKGESAVEIGSGVKYLKELASPAPCGKGAIDIVGTGGDGLNTINISTASSFIAAAAGAKVLKHGNRSVSSKSGSSDLLEALGIDVNNLKEKGDKAYEDTNISFLYAPLYHPALKSIGPVRRDLGVKSIFNIMGPLANPSSPDYMLLGVYSEGLMEKMALSLQNIGVKRAMVVHGVEEGCDEISICGTTKVIEIAGTKLKRYNINPEELGLKKRDIKEIEGGTPVENARHIENVFLGTDKGAKRDALVINTAGALYISGKTDTLIEGIKVAKDTIDSGKAYEKLREYVEAVR